MPDPQREALRHIAVLIPARQPAWTLVELALALRMAEFGQVLIVDDGSGIASQPVFDELRTAGFDVLRHSRNFGKGRALKSGFRRILADHPHLLGVVTADADGQHTAADIVRIAQALSAEFHATQTRSVLGVRRFETSVPWRSRLGNGLTRAIFSSALRTQVRDTQTGLRAFPVSLLPLLLNLQGERYEYEMNVLLFLFRRGKRPLEVPIATVYANGSRSSHFRPVLDSIRVYAVLLRVCVLEIFRSAHRGCTDNAFCRWLQARLFLASWKSG